MPRGLFGYFFRLTSFEERLIATHNRPSGFDYLRLALALAVVVYHSWIESYGLSPQTDPANSPFRPLVIAVLPMFFALSGFLVAGSLERARTLLGFLGFRAFRIMPALAVEVLLSALVLGPLLTTVPLATYFSDPKFFAYFGNIIGNVHFVLPGMFPSNPIPHWVNLQLWTIPIELECYLVLSLCAIFSLFERRGRLALCLIALYIYQTIGALRVGPVPSDVVVGGIHLVMPFLAGAVLYRYRDKVPYSLPLFILGLVVCVALLSNTTAQRFASLPIAYITCYLGLSDQPRNRLLLSGDYSYGIYLYSAPIQQAIAYISPVMWHWYWNLLLGIPGSFLFAAGSWWLIEKPILSRRNCVKIIEEWYLTVKWYMQTML